MIPRDNFWALVLSYHRIHESDLGHHQACKTNTFIHWAILPVLRFKNIYFLCLVFCLQYILCMYSALWGQKSVPELLGLCWKWNLCPLQEQQVLLTFEPSFQPWNIAIYFNLWVFKKAFIIMCVHAQGGRRGCQIIWSRMIVGCELPDVGTENWIHSPGRALNH